MLPVLRLLLLLLQAVEGEEGRVEARQQHGEEQRGAAHHHNTERGRGGGRLRSLLEVLVNKIKARVDADPCSRLEFRLLSGEGG